MPFSWTYRIGRYRLRRPRRGDHWHPPRGCQGDTAPHELHPIARRESQLEPEENLREHDLHLVEGESHADAAPHPAAEGEKFVGARARAEEARGIEALRIRPDLWPDRARFDPTRFLGTRPSPYEFIAFGGGVRRCTGRALAISA